MRPTLPRPARSIIERQRVVLSRCVFAFGLPDNGVLPELDDQRIFTIRLHTACATDERKSHASPPASVQFSVFSFQKGHLPTRRGRFSLGEATANSRGCQPTGNSAHQFKALNGATQQSNSLTQRGCPISNTNLDPTSGQLHQSRDTYSGIENHNKESTMDETKKKPTTAPVKTIRHGAIAASVWKRQATSGFEYFDFTVSR